MYKMVRAMVISLKSSFPTWGKETKADVFTPTFLKGVLSGAKTITVVTHKLCG
ncbi:hypothetical protein VAEKB19_3820034 [Vibrio aestuarianus]|nr:hypothetical protein VAEKB19_3820034 [Vibrio aestuarianus]